MTRKLLIIDILFKNTKTGFRPILFEITLGLALLRVHYRRLVDEATGLVLLSGPQRCQVPRKIVLVRLHAHDYRRHCHCPANCK